VGRYIFRNVSASEPKEISDFRRSVHEKIKFNFHYSIFNIFLSKVLLWSLTSRDAWVVDSLGTNDPRR
jgi:hypothetical protein